VAQHLGAERYQRSPERHAERNGYRGRRGQVQNWADPDPRRLISWTGTRAHENSWTARDSRGTHDITFSARDLTVTVSRVSPLSHEPWATRRQPVVDIDDQIRVDVSPLGSWQ
jgi:hypothetical protein